MQAQFILNPNKTNEHAFGNSYNTGIRQTWCWIFQNQMRYRGRGWPSTHQYGPRSSVQNL